VSGRYCRYSQKPQPTAATVPRQQWRGQSHARDNASLEETPSRLIYCDPSATLRTTGFATPDLTSITHDTAITIDTETLRIVGDNTQIVTNPAVFDIAARRLNAKRTRCQRRNSQRSIDSKPIPPL